MSVKPVTFSFDSDVPFQTGKYNGLVDASLELEAGFGRQDHGPTATHDPAVFPKASMHWQNFGTQLSPNYILVSSDGMSAEMTYQDSGFFVFAFELEKPFASYEDWGVIAFANHLIILPELIHLRTNSTGYFYAEDSYQWVSAIAVGVRR